MTELRWMCPTCLQPITDGSGLVAISMLDVRQAEAAMAAWRDAHSTNPLGVITVPLATLRTAPEPASWGVHHEACMPEEVSAEYWFPLARCRTGDDLLMWTLHLMDKSWLEHTNWSTFAANLARASGIVDP